MCDTSGRAPAARPHRERLPRASSRAATAAVLLAILGACRTSGSQRKPEPLADEGELHVYLEPFERASPHVAFTLAALSAVALDGTVVPLAVRTREVDASSVAHRLLAVGRVAPGAYAGLLAVVGGATLDRHGERTSLLAPPEGVRLDAPFTVSRGRGTLLSLRFDPERSVERGFAFDPAFDVASPAPPVPGLFTLCSSEGADTVTVIDRHARRAVAVVPTGRDPMGVVLDDGTGLAYVALTGEDRVIVLDVLSGTSPGSIVLRPGDEPREVSLAGGERTLVVVNAGSSTASFVDLGSLAEVARAPVGLDPVAIASDPSGRRAYVLNRGSSTVTVLDLVTRTVAATVATDAEPVAAALNRAGTRLHVAHARSPYLTTLALPELALVARTFVGAGTSAVAVDPRTDLLFVGRWDDDRVLVLDPTSLLPVRQLEVAGAPAALALDPTESVIFAAAPGRGAVSATDLLSGRLLAVVEVGAAPRRLAIAGARR